MDNQDEDPPKTKMPFDPGWNDPPTLSFNTQTASKPRNLLNKRVAFPLNAQNQETLPVATTLPPNLPTFPQVYNPALPPLPVNSQNTGVNIALTPAYTAPNLTNTPFNLVNTAANSGNGARENFIDTDKLLFEVNSTMYDLLEKNMELGQKAIDIRKRLQTMEEMWKENKLNYEIQVKMQQLAHALKSNELEEAENIQKVLMVDHVSSVSTWMVGIRQLIHYCQAKEELMKIDQSEGR